MPPLKATTAALPHKVQRQPRQSRGEVRVAAILDACERLLIEEGESALAMHRVAAEALTSIGSLYHFFPNKQSLLRALAERHEGAIEAIVARIDALPDSTWQAANACEVVQRMSMPLLNYIAANPGLLYLIRLDRAVGKAPTDNPLQPLLQALCLRVLALRLPNASPQAQCTYAATLLGLPLGLVTDLMVDYDATMRAALLQQEIPRALVAYLEAIERAEAPRQ